MSQLQVDLNPLAFSVAISTFQLCRKHLQSTALFSQLRQTCLRTCASVASATALRRHKEKDNIGVYMGIMEKKMETTIMGYIGITGYICEFLSL